MANKSIADVILSIRQLSNTVRRQVVTDDEVLARANEGLSNLYDLINGAHGSFFVTPYPFTLVGGYGASAAPLPTDFYHAKALDRFLGTSPGPRMSVPQASSYAERNDFGNRVYDIVAGNVVVDPPALAAGNYELQYIPKCPVLFDGTIPVTHTALAIPITPFRPIDNVVSGTKVWTFVNADFTQSLVGASLVVTGATNAGNNGTFVITAVLNTQTVITGGAVGLVSETFTAATFNIAPLPDHVTAASNQWTFAALTPDPSYVGGKLVVSGLPGSTNNGSFPITGIVLPHTLVTGGQALTDAVFDASSPYSYMVVQAQPIATSATVVDSLNDWVLFAELDAAVAILDKQNLDSSAIQGRRAQQEARIEAAARARRDQPYQVPMRRRRGSAWRGGFC